MSAGETEQVGVSEPVPLSWCFLCLCEAHEQECRNIVWIAGVHRPTPSGPRLITTSLSSSTLDQGSLVCVHVSVCCDKAHGSPTCPGEHAVPVAAPLLTLSETALGPAGGLGTCPHQGWTKPPPPEQGGPLSPVFTAADAVWRSMWSLLCPSPLTQEPLGECEPSLSLSGTPRAMARIKYVCSWEMGSSSALQDNKNFSKPSCLLSPLGPGPSPRSPTCSQAS